ncbi:hypothetical protein PM082_004467 [Marasmius tenuissimus]|nr:hypothetical protein PM082_004467 [Marasmius tenuissimus]
MDSRQRHRHGTTAFYEQPTASGLVERIIRAHPDTINLTDLTMRSSRLIKVLSVFDASHRIQYLNISHNNYVSVKTLRTILEARPHIHRLVLYGTSISGDDLDSMLKREGHLFYGVDELVHRSLFSSNDRERRYSAFSFFFSVPGHVPTSHKAALTSTPSEKTYFANHQ